MKRSTKIILGILGFLVGLGLVAYPYVSDYVHKATEQRIIGDQREAVSQADDSALKAELQASQEYNERLLSSRSVITDPFDPNNQPVSNDEYMARDNIAGDGVMGTLVIPKINASLPIYHGTTDDVLGKGVGHMEATSLPVGGASTHAALAGHNGLPSVRIFDDLYKVEVGDYFVIEVLGEDHAYRVTSIETVLPEETDSLAVQEGKDLVTLITCTPYGVNTHRLLVHAERCEVPDEWYAHDKDATDGMPSAGNLLIPFTLAGLAIGAGVVAWRVLRARQGAAAARGAHGAFGGGLRGGGARGGAHGGGVARGGSHGGGPRHAGSYAHGSRFSRSGNGAKPYGPVLLGSDDDPANQAKRGSSAKPAHRSEHFGSANPDHRKTRKRP